MSKTKTRCLVEAGAWQIHLADNDLESTPEFEAWLEADPQNRTAWDQVQKSWEFVGQHAASPELLELRHRALADARDTARLRWTLMTKDSAGASDGPVSLQTSLPNQDPPLDDRIGMSSRPRKRTVRVAVATAAAAAIVGIVAWFINSEDVYRTATGERRVVALVDGSQVQLDSSTELRVRYNDHSRELALLRGQARFDVAHDIERPFVVAAGGRKVVATGTAFNVDLLGKSMVVTMIEGHVVVLAAATTHLSQIIQQFAHSRTEGETAAPSPGASSLRTDPGVELGVGQELVISSSGNPRITEANVERTISWQTGQLVFDNEVLTSVVERMNRYSTKPLEIDDERTRNLRISGVFSESDVPGFVETLTHYLPLRADLRGHVIHLSHR
jgi:transmembrane sensor